MLEFIGKANAIRRRVIFWVMIFVVIVGGGGLLFPMLSRLISHSPVDATITAVEEECSLVRTERRRRGSTQRMPCPQAQALSAAPDYENWEVRRHQVALYSYVSPADGRTHRGRADRIRSDRTGLQAGATIRVWAHKRRPSESRRGLF